MHDASFHTLYVSYIVFFFELVQFFPLAIVALNNLKVCIMLIQFPFISHAIVMIRGISQMFLLKPVYIIFFMKRVFLKKKL